MRFRNYLCAVPGPMSDCLLQSRHIRDNIIFNHYAKPRDTGDKFNDVRFVDTFRNKFRCQNQHFDINHTDTGLKIPIPKPLRRYLSHDFIELADYFNEARFLSCEVLIVYAFMVTFVKEHYRETPLWSMKKNHCSICVRKVFSSIARPAPENELLAK